MSDFAQILMHELDSYRAFTDSGSDAFNRTVANIANRKNAGDIRFK
jgi:hypothetical protein